MMMNILSAPDNSGPVSKFVDSCSARFTAGTDVKLAAFCQINLLTPDNSYETQLDALGDITLQNQFKAILGNAEPDWKKWLAILQH
jgi:ubiquinone biosynthesis protein UbiJ